MLNSQSAMAAVRRYSSREQASRVAPRDRRDIPAERLTPTAEIFDAEANLLPASNSLPAKRPAMAGADATRPSVFWFLLEGFALYGASLHCLATTAVTAIASEVGARQHQKPARSKRQKSTTLVSPAARAEITVLEREDAIDRTAFGTRMPSTRDGFASPTREVDQYRFVHPGWLAIVWRAIASRWAKWRREREVKKAVAALAQYDDRTLRDMGILHRSQIEQTVREGRDS
jgi:uncharacterized protein YjiS (DUF1127 family)